MDENSRVALPGFHCLLGCLWLVDRLIMPNSQGIISEIQNYVKKLQILNVPYEFDEMQFDTDQILPGF